jgi:hypothetical protein
MCGLLARLGAIFAGILGSFRGRLGSWIDRKIRWRLCSRYRLMEDVSLGDWYCIASDSRPVIC